MAQVFISYAKADRERARRLAAAMEAKGYSVWWDRQIAPGRTFDEVIEEALAAASCVVVLWSATSVKSDWVKTEAAEAASRKVLVPALIDDVRIPLEFRRLQAADLTKWDGKSDDPEFERFLHAVDTEIKENETETAQPRLPSSVGSISEPAVVMAPPPEPIPVQSASATPAAARYQPEAAPAYRKSQAESKPQAVRPQSGKWALVALPVLVIAMIAGYWFSKTADVQTPQVVGMLYENATAAFATAGVAVERQDQASATDAPGTVLAQLPAAGMTLNPATKVVLTVAVAVSPEPVVTAVASVPAALTDEIKPDVLPVDPPVPVPDLKGKTSEDAIKLLSDAGLTLGVRTPAADNNVALGTVLSQDPEPTQTLAKNSPVNITVVTSRKVPELVGLDLQKAEAELARLGLTGLIERVPAPRGETDNRVVKQSRDPGLDIESGGELQLTIAIVTPKTLPGGAIRLRDSMGRACNQVCKDSGLRWTTGWSGERNTCTCTF